MTKQEAMRQTQQENTLMELGFTRVEVEQLRRISMTLWRWYELECGTGEGQTTRSIEREGDDGEGKPFLRIQYPTAQGYVDRKEPIADRERGAVKRLTTVINARNNRCANSSGKVLSVYLQTDPRGAALYIIRPGDVPDGADVSAYYSRGICVY